MKQLRDWDERDGFRDGSDGEEEEEEEEVGNEESVDDEEEFGDEEKIKGADDGEKVDDQESNDGTEGWYASKNVSDTQYWDSRDLEKLVQSTIHLIQGAGLRPRREKLTSSRYYLRLSPLCRLVNMYYQREATYRPDKIYALLGMSSDDPGAAGFLPEYGIPWEEVFRRFVRCILGSDRALVTAWDDSDIVVIGGKGCVLGIVEWAEQRWVRTSRTGREDEIVNPLAIHWSKHAIALGWIDETERSETLLEFYTSIGDVRTGDALYLPEGASVPLIIRTLKDYATVVRIVDGVSRQTKPARDDFEWPENCLLIWDWGSATYSHPQYFMDSRIPNSMKAQHEGDLSKAIRLVQTLLLKYTPKIITKWRTQAGLREDIDDYVTVGPNEPEMELLEICDRIMPAVNNRSARAYELLFKLMAKPSTHELDWPMCRSPLWLAALTGRKDLAVGILDIGKASGFWELRLAAGKTDEAVVDLLLDTGKVDLMMKDAEGNTAAFYAMAKHHRHPVTRSSWLYHEKGISHNRPYPDDTVAQLKIFHRFMATNKAVGEVILQKGLEHGILEGEAIVSLAERYGLDLGTKNKHGQTLMMLAARYGNEYLVRHLVAGDHDLLDDRDDEGRTPLMLASLGCSKNMVAFLVGAGQSLLNINSRDNKGETAVIIAASRSAHRHAEEIVGCLVNCEGIELGGRDESGRTLLMLAASRGWGYIVRNLVENHQADLNVVDREGRTALMHAIRGNAIGQDSAMDALDYLLRNDEVDVEVRDINGKSALTLIQKASSKESGYMLTKQEYAIEECTIEDENLDTRERLLDCMKRMWDSHMEYKRIESMF